MAPTTGRTPKKKNSIQQEDTRETTGQQTDEDRDSDASSSSTYSDDREIRKHKSYEQVMLDVNRCAGRLEHIKRVYFHRTDDDYECHEDLTDELERIANESGSERIEGNTLIDAHDAIDGDFGELSAIKRGRIEAINNQRELKLKLARLIVKLLIKKPDLHYYQGFHDVCLTYMTILGDETAYTRLDHLIDSHFGIFMQPTMNETQEFLALIPIIIGQHNFRIQEFLERAEVGTIFALSWVITWFSHVIPNQRDVETIFKFLEREDPHMVLYLCAQIVLHTQDRLLELEAEMSTVHHFLSQVPRKDKLPLDRLLNKATESFARWPPDIVKQKLDNHRKAKLQMHNYNLLRSLASRFGPALSSLVPTNTRTAIIVIVLASALALQFDRWTR